MSTQCRVFEGSRPHHASAAAAQQGTPTCLRVGSKKSGAGVGFLHLTCNKCNKTPQQVAANGCCLRKRRGWGAGSTSSLAGVRPCVQQAARQAGVKPDSHSRAGMAGTRSAGGWPAACQPSTRLVGYMTLRCHADRQESREEEGGGGCWRRDRWLALPAGALAGRRPGPARVPSQAKPPTDGCCS
jgi:hypothetical protein